MCNHVQQNSLADVARTSEGTALTQARVTDINAPELSREDDHHLRRVLRARDGEEIVALDGRSYRLGPDNVAIADQNGSALPVTFGPASTSGGAGGLMVSSSHVASRCAPSGNSTSVRRHR